MNSIRTSINLKFDFNNTEVLNQYIPTNTHKDFLLSFLNGISKKNSPRAHIVFGPYGTGKTYLLNVLLTMSVAPNQFKEAKIFNKFSLDSELSEVLDTYKLFLGKNQNFIPLIINGFEGNLNEVLFDQLAKIAQTNKIPFEIDFFASILAIIQQWKSEYPDAYQKYLTHVKNEGISHDEFENRIKSNNTKAIHKFEKIYKIITSGAELPIKKNFNLISSLEKILEGLKKKDKGIIFVHDEFGRFLQNINQDNLINTLQDLQELAELANNGAENFSFVLIAHKPISAYFSRFSSDFKPEFERIEKRFIPHFITSNEKVTFKLAKYYLQEFNKKFTKKQEETILNNVNSSNFFKDFSQNEILNDLIKGIAPFNPFTLYYLNFLSSVYGQNERSMMSFLEYSAKSDFVKSTIFDISPYFFPTINQLPEDTQYLKLLKRKLNNNQLLQKQKKTSDIFIFISFWFSLGLNKIQSINSKSLSIIFGEAESYFDSHFFDLENQKLIRKNILTEGYEPYESSGVNIDQVVKENFQNITINNEQYASVVEDLIGINNIKAYFYNYNFKMTRFASIVYNFSPIQTIEKIEKSNTDFIILINFVEETSSQKELNQYKISFSKNEKIMNVLIPVNFKQLLPRIEKLISAKFLKVNKSEYSNFNYFSEELDFFIQENQEIIKEILSNLVRFSFGKVFYLGNEFIINNKFDLIQKISDIFAKIYKKTIVINNDQINKFHITTVQKNALELLGNQLIKFIPLDDNGNGPEVLAYLTIFKENLFNPFEYETNSFGKFEELRTKIYALLTNKIEVKNLTEILTSVNFGYSFRKPLIPVILLGILRPIWDNLIFFGNNTFIKEIDYKFFENMLFDNSNSFYVNRLIYDEEQTYVINLLIEKFKEFEQSRYLPKHIRAYSVSNTWLKNKGQFVQQTHRMSEYTIAIRDLIQQSEFIPLEAYSKLYSLKKKFIDSFEEIENFLSLRKREIFEVIQGVFKEKDFTKIKLIAKKLKKEILVSNKLASTIITSLDEHDLVENLSIRILEKEFKDISDSIFDMLRNQIEILTKTALTGDYDKNQVNVVSINEQIIAFPKVNQSVTGVNLKTRIEGMVSASKLRVSKEEIVQILFEILKNKVGN
jgi:hypothetical protein